MIPLLPAVECARYVFGQSHALLACTTGVEAVIALGVLGSKLHLRSVAEEKREATMVSNAVRSGRWRGSQR